MIISTPPKPIGNGIAYDNQLHSQIAIDWRPKIIRELDERGWDSTKPLPDSSTFFASGQLWGAFDAMVTRDLEMNRDSLAASNGIVSIRDGKPTIRPFDPSIDTNTHCSPITYAEPSPEAMDRLCKLQEQWFPGDAGSKFQEMIATALFKPNHRRILQILAPAATGKVHSHKHPATDLRDIHAIPYPRKRYNNAHHTTKVYAI